MCVSKCAQVHREGLPFCHPVVGDPAPSEAARFVADELLPQTSRHPTVVDLGCGEGRDTVFLAREGCRVLAVDISERSLGVVTGKLEGLEQAPEACHCIVADLVEGIPAENAMADAVLDVWVLGSVIIPHDGRQGARRYLAEVHRILKPGGLLVAQFETLKPRRSAEQLRGYVSRLLGKRFSVMRSVAMSADYREYVETPRPVGAIPALFVVAARETAAP